MSIGAGIRYDGNHLDRERAKGPSLGVYLNFAKRYCEHCSSWQPRLGEAVKGWKCAKCRTAEV